MQDSTVTVVFQGTCVTVYPLLGKNLIFPLTTASGHVDFLSYS